MEQQKKTVSERALMLWITGALSAAKYLQQELDLSFIILHIFS